MVFVNQASSKPMDYDHIASEKYIKSLVYNYGKYRNVIGVLEFLKKLIFFL